MGNENLREHAGLDCYVGFERGGLWMKLMTLVVLSFLFLAVSTVSAPAGDLLHARKIYMANCAVCHGEFGKGDGPRGKTFNPAPADFSNRQTMANLGPADLERAVVRGVPNVKEHAFGHILSVGDVKDVIDYLRTFLR
jgi:mono/diheme cytochrome c family protein